MSEGAHERVTLERAQRLSETVLFEGAAIDTQAIHALASAARVVSYETGDNIVREGEDGDCMYVLKSGTGEIRKRTLGGEPYTVEVLSAGRDGFFGEIALVDRDTRSATVICTTSCQVYIITREQFQSLSERFPRLGLAVTREIARLLCIRLRRANNDVIALFSALVEEVAESGGLSGRP